jgi:vitamin B12 transporter
VKKLNFLLLLLGLHKEVLAQDAIMVTADRISSSLEDSPSDIAVFTEEDVKSASSIKELLNQSSDINITQTGSAGGNTSIFLRGSDSSHTLVIIDGIIMNDPSNPNRQFDLGRLSLNNIARIEVLKGSQGLLYGSNAIGGVILITTKSGQGKDTASANVEYGTYSTINAAVSGNKKFEQTEFGLGLDFLDSRGFSAANDSTTTPADSDGVKRMTLDSSLTQKFSHKKLQFNYRLVNDNADLDKSGGNGSDDPNDTQFTQQQFMKLEFNQEWSEGETKIFTSKTKHHRTLNVLPDSVNPESSAVTTKGMIDTISANHTQYFSSLFTQYFSVDYQKEEDQLDNWNENTSLFTYGRFDINSNTFTLGGRVDFNQSFGEHFTYKLAYLYNWGKSSVKASLSTGFRAPSLNQLFDPTYGNSLINPEESLSGDIGGEINIGKFKYSGAIFQTNLKNRLSYDPVTFVNVNKGKARTRGIENNFSISVNDYLTPFLSLTLLQAKDLETNLYLARRPKVKSILGLTGRTDKDELTTTLNYEGKRTDVDNFGNPISMNSYMVWNMEYSKQFNNQFSSSFKIKNIRNVAYEEVFGYGTGGRQIFLSAKYDN